MKSIYNAMRAGLFAASCLFMAGLGLGILAAPAAHADQPTPLVVLAAKKIGIQACLPAITQVAYKYTAGATDQDITLDWNRKAPNSAPFFSMTAMSHGTEHAVLSITAIPLDRHGCALMVQRVFSSTDSCSLIAQRDLSAYVGGRLIDGVLVYSDPSHPQSNYTLVQNSNNCAVIFRTDIPRWSPPG